MGLSSSSRINSITRGGVSYTCVYSAVPGSINSVKARSLHENNMLNNDRAFSGIDAVKNLGPAKKKSPVITGRRPCGLAEAKAQLSVLYEAGLQRRQPAGPEHLRR